MTLHTEAVTIDGHARISLVFEAEKGFDKPEDGHRLLTHISQRLAASSTLDEFLRSRNRIADAFEERARNEYGCHASFVVCVIRAGFSRKSGIDVEAKLEELARFEEYADQLRSKFDSKDAGFIADMETMLDNARRKIVGRRDE